MNKKEFLLDFYAAYSNGKIDEITNYYHNDVEFYDHAFGNLNKKELTSMWNMLFKKAFKNLKIEVSNIRVENGIGYAHINCNYIYLLTNKPVHNIIDTVIEFQDNLIIKQTDIFSLKKWAKQSLGWKEGLLANTSFFKTKLQKRTKKALEKHMASENKTNANEV